MRAIIYRSSGLLEADHQALVRHLPGANPAGIAGRLRRVIDRSALPLAAGHILLGWRVGLSFSGRTGFGNPRFVGELSLLLLPLFGFEDTELLARQAGNVLIQRAGAAFAVFGDVGAIYGKVVRGRPL